MTDASAIGRLPAGTRTRSLCMPGVTSIGLAEESAGGRRTGRLAVRLTVQRKLSPDELARRGWTLLPDYLVTVDGLRLPVDVVERPGLHIPSLAADSGGGGPPVPLPDRRARFDPIQPGISIGRADGRPGTLGAVVYDLASGNTCLLSNWHVLRGPTGDVGDPIYQPALDDGGNPTRDRVGQLLRSHRSSSADCAIASIETRKHVPAILGLGVVPARVQRPQPEDLVVKSGRTTGVTYGVVTAIDVQTAVSYGGITRYVRGFEIGPRAAGGELTAGGDSGSLWLLDASPAENGVAVGLQVSGEDSAAVPTQSAFACYMDEVCRALNVSLTAPR